MLPAKISNHTFTDYELQNFLKALLKIGTCMFKIYIVEAFRSTLIIITSLHDAGLLWIVARMLQCNCYAVASVF